MRNKKIMVNESAILLKKVGEDDYLSLSDMARSAWGEDSIKNWMKNKDTIEFLGVWEKLNNPLFNTDAYGDFWSQAGSSRFFMTPQRWKDATWATGIYSQAGRGGWTYAHIDIALEFATHLNPAFRLFLLKDYQRLKKEEQYKIDTNWDQKRAMSKINYWFMTDAIKDHLIPESLSKNRIPFVYAEEADVVNMALFGVTASQWRWENPQYKQEWFNMRDFASPEQLVVLANLEFKDSELIADWMPQEERLLLLNQIAIYQMTKLTAKDILPSIPKAIISKKPKIP